MLYFCKTSTKCLFCKANCEAQQIKAKRVGDLVVEKTEARATTSLPEDESSEENGQGELRNEKREGTENSSEGHGDCSCHKFPVQFLGSSVNQWENTEAFHENLKYVFVLREMLDYPKRKCIKFLKNKHVESLPSSKNNDATDKTTMENGWFSVCDGCTKIVEEGHLIYHEMEKLSLKLEGLKNNLSELLIESQKEEETDKGDDGHEDNDGMGSIFTEVREHFFPKKRPSAQPLVVGPVVKMEVEASLLPLDDDADPQLDDLFPDENFDEGSDWAPSEGDLDAGQDEVDEDVDAEEPLDIKPNIEELDAQRQEDANNQDKNSAMTQIATGVMEKKMSKMKPAPKSRKMLRLTRSSIRQQEETLDSEEEEEIADGDDGAVEADERRKELKRKRSKSILSDSESETTSESEKSDESDYGGNSGNKEKFPCKICGAVYQTKHRLKEHKNLHSSEDAFKCDKCAFVSATTRGLRMHTTKIHGEVTLGKHVEVVKKKRISSKQESIDDSSSSPSKASKVKSQTPQSSGSGDLACSYCPVTYQTTHRLKEHEEHHHRDDVIKCGQCNYVCILERGMKIHVSKYHNRKEYKRMSAKEKNSGSGDEEKQEEEYICQLCGATYRSPHRIREHKQLHLSKHAIRCPESACLFVCKTERGLVVHMNAQHGKGPAKSKKRNRKEMKIKPKLFRNEPRHCKLCPAKYHTKKRFSQHMSLHRKDINFPCDECGWVFSEESKRDYHYKLSHTKRQWCRKTYQCIYCEITPFEYRYKYMEHLRLNHQSKIVQCTNCDEPCESQDAFNVHYEKCTRKHEEYYEGEESTDADEKPFSCPKCDTTFRQKENLKKHMINKHSTEEFPCEHCPSVFPTEGRLRYHLARQHDKIQNVCKICNYKAHGASHLRLHMQKHTKERLFACEMCGKTFVSPTYLTAHKQKEHYEELGMDPIKCDQCDLLLPTKSILKYHIQKVHEKKFKFFCELCGKGFLFASGLKNHAAAHSTERNEICKFCGAAYVYNRVLQEHMKNHHPEEYAALKGIDRKSVKTTLNINTQGPFTCKLCNQEFPFRWGWHNHMKTHTEVYDRFKCGICGKGYSSPAGVKRHEETAHVANTFSCQDCGKTFPCRDYLRYHMKNHCHKKEEQSAANVKSEQASTSDSLRAKKSDIKYDPHIVKEAGQLHIVTPSATASSSSAMQIPHNMSNFQYSQVQPGSGASSSSSYVATPTQHQHPHHHQNIQQPENLGDPEAVSSFYRSFFTQHGLPNK